MATITLNEKQYTAEEFQKLKEEYESKKIKVVEVSPGVWKTRLDG